MTFTDSAWFVFEQAVADYHLMDDVDAPEKNPYKVGSLEHTLYHKCRIDSVQWHLEDLIRDPEIEPSKGMQLKHRIDRSNQDRTDLVEQIDDYFYSLYKEVKILDDATLNTETPAWTVDRLSILSLKIWHMREQAEREDAEPLHREKANAKLQTLLEQKDDLCCALDMLLEDFETGRKRMKLYRQMKLYNDPDTNPVLYSKK